MPGFLNRYTTLPVLIDMIAEKRLTLISPEKWEDRNDAHFIEVFRQKKNFKSVLGICFSSTRETFHHWKVYASGMSGVCIEFDKDKIIRAIKGLANVLYGEVSYKLIHEAQANRPNIDNLPFLKRKPFKDENEFRIIYWNDKSRISSYDIPIELRFINKVTLSPFMPETLKKSLKSAIWNIQKSNALRIIHSTLLDNDEWKKIADEA